jgi:hypothetical protein
LSIIAIDSIERNKGKTTDKGNSGTEGVSVGFGVGVAIGVGDGLFECTPELLESAISMTPTTIITIINAITRYFIQLFADDEGGIGEGGG